MKLAKILFPALVCLLSLFVLFSGTQKAFAYTGTVLPIGDGAADTVRSV